MDYGKLAIMAILITGFLFIGDTCFVGCGNNLELLQTNDPTTKLIRINGTFSDNVTSLVDIGAGGSLAAGTTNFYESGIDATVQFLGWIFQVFTNPAGKLKAYGLPDVSIYLYGIVLTTIGLLFMAMWTRGVKL